MDSLCCCTEHEVPCGTCWLANLTEWHTAHEAYDAVSLPNKLVWPAYDVSSSLVSLRASPQEPEGDAEL